MSYYDHVYQAYKDYFPMYEKITVYHYLVGREELFVRLSDGRKFIFDTVHNSIRNVTRYKRFASEQEWRHEFKYRLWRSMESRGFNQKRLADACGVSESSISKYTSGKASPSHYTLIKIADALGCDIREFEFYEEEGDPEYGMDN